MKEVKPIFESKVDQKTIDTLEDLLAKAKTGELRAVMFVDAYRDGSTAHGWAGQPNTHMIGELEDLKFDIFSAAYFPVMDEET